MRSTVSHDDFPLRAAIAAGAIDVASGRRGLADEIGLLRHAGLLQAPLPPAQGGCGLGTSPHGTLPAADLLAMLGGVSLPLARLYEGHVTALRLMLRHGTPQQRADMVQSVQDGALWADWGADAQEPARAMAVPGGLALRGSKVFCSGLGLADWAIVTVTDARDECQMLALRVADHDTELAASPMAAMAGAAGGRLPLDGIVVTPAEIIGSPGAILAEPDCHGGLWRLCAIWAGALRGIAAMVETVPHREGPEVAAVDIDRRARLLLAAETAWLWTHSAATAVEAADATASTIETALLAREAVELAVHDGLALAERIAGTALHKTEAPAAILARDLRLFVRQASPDSRLRTAYYLWKHRQAATNVV